MNKPTETYKPIEEHTYHTKKMKPFIALIRDSENFDELIKRRPTAFVLLTLIAKRARRTDTSNFNDLEIGEALLGDYETYGSTEQKYKTDKSYLEKYLFSTFRTTNRGTIAKLTDTSILDPNLETSTNELTSNQRATNEQPTTNKNDKKEKEEVGEQKHLKKAETETGENQEPPLSESLKPLYDLISQHASNHSLSVSLFNSSATAWLIKAGPALLLTEFKNCVAWYTEAGKPLTHPLSSFNRWMKNYKPESASQNSPSSFKSSASFSEDNYPYRRAEDVPDFNLASPRHRELISSFCGSGCPVSVSWIPPLNCPPSYYKRYEEFQRRGVEQGVFSVVDGKIVESA